MLNLLPPRHAAYVLGISYSTLKLWIYRGKINSVKTVGGHHRVPQSEIERLVPERLLHRAFQLPQRRPLRISERNQLVGQVQEVKFDGLIAQVKLAIDGQLVTSIITADAARELRLKPGKRAAALVKAMEVMILRI